MKPRLYQTYNEDGWSRKTIWLDDDNNEYTSVEACRALFQDEDVMVIKLRRKRMRLLLTLR